MDERQSRLCVSLHLHTFRLTIFSPKHDANDGQYSTNENPNQMGFDYHCHVTKQIFITRVGTYRLSQHLQLYKHRTDHEYRASLSGQAYGKVDHQGVK